MIIYLNTYIVLYNIYMNNVEITYIIKNLTFDVEFEDNFFQDEDIKYIKHHIDLLSKCIAIDKSYVECSQNKHKNTFLIENGWNALKETLIDSEFGLKLLNDHQHAIVEAFSTMAKCYMYDAISEYYKDKYENIYEHINITPSITSTFDVIICKDASDEWKKYKGDWTQWK